MMKHILLLSMSFFTYCVSSCWKTCGGDYTVYNTRYRISIFLLHALYHCFALFVLKTRDPFLVFRSAHVPSAEQFFLVGRMERKREDNKAICHQEMARDIQKSGLW